MTRPNYAAPVYTFNAILIFTIYICLTVIKIIIRLKTADLYSGC